MLENGGPDCLPWSLHHHLRTLNCLDSQLTVTQGLESDKQSSQKTDPEASEK